MNRHVKRLSGTLAAFMLAAAIAVPAFASEVTSPAGKTPIPVTVTTATDGSPLLFRVTMPTALAVNVTSNGDVTVATNAAITNLSAGAVAVSGMTITSADGWEIAPYDSNFAKLPVNSKTIALDVNGCKTLGTNSISFQPSAFKNKSHEPYMWAGTGNGETISNNTVDLDVGAKVSAQSTALTGVTAANLVFTVSWYTGR